MKLMIDIPKDVKAVIDRNGTNEVVAEIIWQAVKNGTPLPKEHGRLMILSEDVVKRQQTSFSFSCQNWVSEVGLSNATVAIIEAEKAESEE